MWSYILLMSILVACVAAHGRVFRPPSRASAWRFGFPTPEDYDDDGANCGGYAEQHSSNGGKCGICGDAYNIEPPRPHELGGIYGLGLVVAHYLPGSLMTTTVDLTTSHRGFWQFKLCPDPNSNDQACFDRHVLATEDGETKYYPNQGSTKYNVTYRLPSGLVCDHCVLQWRYTAGNNWGICANGSTGLGCGNQEQFGACSDISIGMLKNMLREETQNDDIPAPLMYYLKNGYFDAQQGILQLLRGKVPPNKIESSHNAVQQSERPSWGHQQRPTQLNQQKQRPVQSTQVHPNQIVSQNSRPVQDAQSSQKLVQNPQRTVQSNSHTQGKPVQSGQQNQSKNQRLVQAQQSVLRSLEKQNHYNHQLSPNHQQFIVQSRPQNSHQSIHQNPVQQNKKPHSQLDALGQKHREQKQLKKQNQMKSVHSSQTSIQNLPITQSLQITTHAVHSYTLPVKQLSGPYEIKQWKTGKSARYKKSKKHKRKGKPRKRKKKIAKHNRIIKVGTW